ncbi:MAG: short-chain dehydrogenase [Candidatus Sericytochromatia bacterium]|nr:MAG: short-chain dehydrogenase [Candidatus Sericytochromatia bacterium]
MSSKIILVTGANKGIGLEIVKQLAELKHSVILTSRNENLGIKAVNSLKEKNLNVDYHQLEVTSDESIEKAFDYVKNKYGKLDVLINNAGVFLENQENSSFFNCDIDIIKQTMEINFFGALKVSKKFVDLLKQSDDARIINMSSGMGQLSEMGGGYIGYRVSKTSLNALTRIMSNELRKYKIKVNTMCPGWVKTDMGGPNATRELPQGADTAVWLATVEDCPTGKFFKDRKEIDW